MSWLELDDRILEHPKFIRAVKLGGSEVVHLWLGVRAYCGQLLTDGHVPADMIDEVRGPREPRKRAAALDALVEAGLIRRTPAGLEMHDYLQWSSSRDEVLDRRLSARDRKRRNRVTDSVVTEVSRRDGHESSVGVTDPRARVSTPLRSPSPPLPSDPHQSGSGAGVPGFMRAPRSLIPVAVKTVAFKSVFDRYPRKEGELKAAVVFGELAAQTPGGESELARLILAAFDAGMLVRAPYVGPNDKRPMLETVLAERRWEDPPSAPDDKPAPRETFAVAAERAREEHATDAAIESLKREQEARQPRQSPREKYLPLVAKGGT